jgi:AraC-like DNA-binding protein
MHEAIQAIASFEATHGLRIVVHDLGNWWDLPAERGIHSHHCCQQVKQTAHGWRCYDLEAVDLRDSWRLWPNGRIHCCHAGVVEAAVPLVWLDELIGVLFAGQIKGTLQTKALCDLVVPTTPAKVIWDQHSLRHLRDSSEATNLLEQLRQLAARLLLLRDPTAPARAPSRERQLERFLQAEYMRTDLCLADVAKQLRLSESRTAHYIKESFGQTFIQLLTHTRLRRAGKLLRNTQTPIADVALQCGYGDLSHFHRVFKKNQQMTPRQYRLHMRSQESVTHD